jgi:hypothetical protein
MMVSWRVVTFRLIAFADIAVGLAAFPLLQQLTARVEPDPGRAEAG